MVAQPLDETGEAHVQKTARATAIAWLTRSGSLSFSNQFVLHPISGQTGTLPDNFAACAIPAKLFIAAMMTSVVRFCRQI